MPENTVMPIDLRALAPAPVATHQRRDAENERKRRHQDRTEPGARAFNGGLDQRLAFCTRRSRATSTIRMAFLADSAISSTRPIWT